jgi:hypothetical protein
MFLLISSIILKVSVLRLTDTQQPLLPAASAAATPLKQPTNHILLQWVFYIQWQTMRWNNSSQGELWHCNKRNLWSLLSEHKHLRKSSCAAFFPPPLLQLGLCQTQPADYLTQLCLCQALTGFSYSTLHSKEVPLCSQGSTFGLESAELLPACLINLLPKSFGVLSVSLWALLQHFWRLILGSEGGVFTSLLQAQCPWPTGRATPARHHHTTLIQGEGASLQVSQVPVAQRNPERLGNQLGSPTHQTGKNLGSNSGLPQEAEGESDQFPETPK